MLTSKSLDITFHQTEKEKKQVHGKDIEYDHLSSIRFSGKEKINTVGRLLIKVVLI